MDHVSIEAQKQLCTELATRKGFNVVDVITHVGSAYNKDNLALLSWKIKYIQSRGTTVRGLIVYQSTRLSRNIEYYSMFRRTMGHKFDVWSVMDNTDTTTSRGSFYIQSGVLHGQQDSTMISERVQASRKYKQDLGGHVGVAGYGYTNVPVDVQVEPGKTVRVMRLALNPNEQAVRAFINKHHGEYSTSAVLTREVRIIPGVEIDERVILYENDVELQQHQRPSDTITYPTLASILNEFGVTKRGSEWTASSVSSASNADSAAYHKQLESAETFDRVSSSCDGMSACCISGSFPEEDMDM